MIQLTYATHDGVALHADLHRPAGDGPFPVAIAISGGGWRVGSRGAMAGWGEYLARHGWATLAIDHRKSSGSKIFPEAVCDVVAAAQFAAGEAEALRLDPARIAMIGSSAGAHLCAMAALAGQSDEFAAEYPQDPHASLRPKVGAMVLAYGVYDLVAQWQHSRLTNATRGTGREEAFLGASPYDDPDLYHRASPLRRVTHATNHVKTLLLWGERDEAVPCSQSEQFALALGQAGHFVRRRVLPEAGHFWFTDDPIDDPHGYTIQVAAPVVRFLHQAFHHGPVHTGG